MTPPSKKATGGSMAGWPDFIKWLLTDALQPLITNQETIMSDLENAKSILQQNTAKIDEIAGDVAELKTSNDELLMMVQELQSQQPDNQLVQDILALAQSQSTSLDSIAAVVPEADVEPPAEEV